MWDFVDIFSTTFLLLSLQAELLIYLSPKLHTDMVLIERVCFQWTIFWDHDLLAHPKESQENRLLLCARTWSSNWELSRRTSQSWRWLDKNLAVCRAWRTVSGTCFKNKISWLVSNSLICFPSYLGSFINHQFQSRIFGELNNCRIISYGMNIKWSSRKLRAKLTFQIFQ